MAEDPKAIFKRISNYTRKAQEALESISSGKSQCFYYPGCGNDFIYPLLHFSDKCDTFVFCDWRVGDRNSFLKEIRTIPNVTICDDRSIPVKDDPKELANMKDILAKFFPQIPPNLRQFLGNPSSKDGQFVELRMGNAEKIVQVFWLAMEGVNVYWKLFASRSIAPRILCIKKNWGVDCDNGWTRFEDCWGHLAAVVRDSACEPEWLVTRENRHNWPWTQLVDRFVDWDDRPVIMWAREKPTPRKRLGRKRRSR
jgi:hypothetical protein